MKVAIKKIFLCAFCLGIICFSLSSCFYMDMLSAEKFEAIDESTIVFVQLQDCVAGDEIATIETNHGQIKIKLFSQESPVATDNFKKLVAQGHYNNYAVTKINQNKAFIATATDGSGKCILGEPFKNQYSNNLWSFPGAVFSISDKEGYGDSRFCILGNCTISDDIFAQMTQSHFPEIVITKYKELGGSPEFDRACNIFGQVYEGLDIVNTITNQAIDQNNKPISEIIIKSITLGTHQ